MRWVAWIIAACAVCVAGMGNAQTPARRIAFIVGNADYNLDGRLDASDAGEAASQRTGHLPDLRNSLNDARDMRDELRKLGFDVSSYKENATRVDMITLLDAFGKKVREAGPEAIVFVYYSGHGMQIEGENFLLPAGAQLQGADFSQMSASAMQAILSGVGTPMTLLRAQFRPRTGDGVNIVVLDACRNNPWDPARRGNGGRGRGLADQNWGLGQTLIAFSTEPGNTAYDGDESDRNSPYTTALKSRVGAANLDLFNMFNTVSRAVEQRTQTWRDGAQRPWINSVTVPPVCLAVCSAPGRSDADKDAFLKAAEEGRAAGYEHFIEAHENSEYAYLAVEALNLLQRAERKIAPIEPTPTEFVGGIPLPPPPLPALCPTADFVVYYEFDGRRLNQAALETIEAAAARARQCRGMAASIRIATYASPETGGERAGIFRALQRGAAAADAMDGFQMPGSIDSITVSVPSQEGQRATADGVREPLNRRVSISVSFRRAS